MKDPRAYLGAFPLARALASPYSNNFSRRARDPESTAESHWRSRPAMKRESLLPTLHEADQAARDSARGWGRSKGASRGDEWSCLKYASSRRGALERGPELQE